MQEKLPCHMMTCFAKSLKFFFYLLALECEFPLFPPYFSFSTPNFSIQRSFFQELLSVIIWCISHPLILTDPCLLPTVRAATTGCICLADTGAYCTQFIPDKLRFGPTGSLPVPARSLWFNQIFITHHWTEEGSAVWPNLSVCHKIKFLLQLEFISVVFQGGFQLHSCLAGMGIWGRAGCCRWARLGAWSEEIWKTSGITSFCSHLLDQSMAQW